MRRRDREITDMDEMRYVLDTCKVIHIGLHDGDDIYILPMNFGYVMDDENRLTFYMHGGMEGKKLDLIRKCSNAAFEMDCDHKLVPGRVACQYSFGYASIMGKGEIQILEDVEEKIRGMELLMSCQTDQKFEFNERLVSIVNVIKLTVNEYSGKRRPVDKKMLKTGIKGKQELQVTEETTAKAMGSGQMEVLATPAMIALMEKTAWMSVAEYMEEGCQTVGTQLSIKHMAPTVMGRKVVCESELIKLEKRRLVFQVTVRDEKGTLVGEGEHERFVVNTEKFLAKANEE